MTCASLESVANKQVLYLTTVGWRTGLPREIEIWFVVWCERLYPFTETREAGGWIKNIRRNPDVKVRIGEWRPDATARVLDPDTDCKLWEQVSAIANRKYGWGEGLPVEITPLPSDAPHSTIGHSVQVDFTGFTSREALAQSPLHRRKPVSMAQMDPGFQAVRKSPGDPQALLFRRSRASGNPGISVACPLFMPGAGSGPPLSRGRRLERPADLITASFAGKARRGRELKHLNGSEQ